MSEDTSLTICAVAALCAASFAIFCVSSCQKRETELKEITHQKYIDSGYVLEPSKPERWVKPEAKQ